MSESERRETLFVKAREIEIVNVGERRKERYFVS